MTDAAVCDIDQHPLFVDMDKVREDAKTFPESVRTHVLKTFTEIAECANSKGVSYPTQRSIANRSRQNLMTVNRDVRLLVELKWITIIDRKKMRNDKNPRCIYAVAQKYRRREPDARSRHYNAKLWEIVGSYLKKYTVGAFKKGCDIARGMTAQKPVFRFTTALLSRDLYDADVYGERYEKAVDYVLARPHTTRVEYEKTLGEAIGEVRKQPVSAPVSKPVSTPVDANDPGARIAAVVAAHPELEEEFLAHPEKAARMAGVSDSTCDAQFDVKPADSVPEPVVSASSSTPEPVSEPEKEPGFIPDWEPFPEADKPIEWEDGSQWPTGPLTKSNNVSAGVKQETNLETLPANTASVSAVGSANTANTASVQNAPKFINGEVDARWRSQQLLHQVNPTMYPAW